MPTMRRVNGLGIDGALLTATFGKIEVPLISASYGDKLEIGELSYMGAQQIDEQTPGTYAVDEMTLKVSTVVFRTLILPRMPQFGGGNIRIPIVIGYGSPEIGRDSDLCDACRLIGWPASVDNTNTPFALELKAKPRQIFWGSQRKTINTLRGQALPIGTASGF